MAETKSVELQARVAEKYRVADKYGEGLESYSQEEKRRIELQTNVRAEYSYNKEM